MNCKMPKLFKPFYCEDLIRLGKDYDGGYLVNKQDVLNTKKLISFGIGDDISFEQDFCKLNDCAVEAYDGSIADAHKDFFVENKKLISDNVSKNTIQTILAGEQKGLFLKCDIDGFEYEILTEIMRDSGRFTGIAMEFHDIHGDENFNDLTDFISKIDLGLVHIHVNNYTYLKGDTFNVPTVLELSFSSSDNKELREEISLPNPLDMPNNPVEPQFRIDF